MLPAHAQTPTGARLATEMGCALCHTDLPLPESPTLREQAPDLNDAGLKYQPGYLFEFLQNPTRERRHLGAARMPDFHLTEMEATALVAFLETKRRPPPAEGWPDWPPEIISPPSLPDQPKSSEAIGWVLDSRQLLCLNCHTLGGRGGLLGLELTRVGRRLRPDWVQYFLAAPDRFGAHSALMPAQFYQRSPDGDRFLELTPDPAEKIREITAALFSLDPAPRAELARRWDEARTRHRDADAALGETLFRSFQCSVCHRLDASAPWPAPSAPQLTGLNVRLRPEWLGGFLKRPTPIRPFGHVPGTGSRMPDFRLSEEEAARLASWLNSLEAPTPAVAVAAPHEPGPISAFGRRKARLLLENQLACLGCHRLEDAGGRIGPDLTDAADRLQPAYILRVIQDPQSAHPQTVMPRIPMPDATARLLAAFLAHRNLDRGARPVQNYLSPTDHTLIPRMHPAEADAVEPDSRTETRRNYLKYCASCHGNTGGGDGYNAAYLPVKPTAHSDANYMATRPDDTLYDGIHSGGFILNKSARMPPWGGTLAPAEIRALVKYLRELCQCDGPAWSRDNAVPTRDP